MESVPSPDLQALAREHRERQREAGRAAMAGGAVVAVAALGAALGILAPGSHPLLGGHGRAGAMGLALAVVGYLGGCWLLALGFQGFDHRAARRAFPFLVIGSVVAIIVIVLLAGLRSERGGGGADNLASALLTPDGARSLLGEEVGPANRHERAGRTQCSYAGRSHRHVVLLLDDADERGRRQLERARGIAHPLPEIGEAALLFPTGFGFVSRGWYVKLGVFGRDPDPSMTTALGALARTIASRLLSVSPPS